MIYYKKNGGMINMRKNFGVETVVLSASGTDHRGPMIRMDILMLQKLKTDCL